jgi:exodeoxyribonuclease V gamma subunit
MNRETAQSTGIHVWYSNQLERLADRLIENLRKTRDDPKTRLFRMPPIIVPNRNIETYLKYEIARGAGIAAGLKFQVTDEFLNELLETRDQKPKSKLADGAVMRAMFVDILSDEADPGRPLPEVVRTYIDAGGADQDARDMRRFQLASRLARLARQYGDTRPGLSRAWAEGQVTLEGDPLEATEQWQRDLWARVVEQPGGPQARARDNRGMEWVLPPQLFEVLAKNQSQSLKEVHIFGFSYLLHGHRELIEHLMKKSEIHIYMLSPFIEFGDDPADLPIVAQWGRPGREYFRMLNEIDGTGFQSDFVPSESSTVLGRLQREILRRSPESNAPFERDDSLAILACPGIRREAEVVANEIWRLIRDDGRRGSPADRLRFRDIAVLLADSANQAAYQAHFRAIFEELHGIPFNMVDLPLAGECQVIEAVLLLLALPLGEFTRPELLKVLTHPAVRARFPEADVNRWRNWCLGLEIVHGADHRDHEGTYIDRDSFHWEQGLRRLVLGAFMTGSHHGDDQVFRLEDAGYLPYDQAADGLADAARLLVLVRSLVADARFARSARLSMTQWSDFFVRMVNAYLAADSDSEQRALSQCLQKIQDLRDQDVAGRKVGYRIACESLREALAGLTGSRGHYLADGVVVSPLLETRALPFRVVFLCGLGEGRFPAVEGPDPLDLTLARRQVGDVSPRERDKYLFLETLACPRDRLYLSYVARDSQTGDELEPSPVVHELVRHLHRGRAGNPIKDWVKSPPLRRFADDYFPRDSKGVRPREVPPNVSPAAWKESCARRLRASLSDHCKGWPRLSLQSLYELKGPLRDWLGLCPIVDAKPDRSAPRRLEISFRDLRQFLLCPLQGWARLMLRLHEDEEEDQAARLDEPFVTRRLGETTLLREVFFDALGRNVRDNVSGAFEPLYDSRAESRARRGLMPVGLFGDVERRRHLACLTGWHQAARQSDLLGAGRFQVHRFGHAGEDERVEQLESAIPLDVPLSNGPNGPRIIRVELVGRTELVARDLPGSMTPVVRDQARDKDFLAGFFDAVTLSLLPGHHDPAEYHAHVIPNSQERDVSKTHRILHNIDESRATRFLTDLLADLLGRPHDYLLPCEAVFEHLLKGTSIEAIVEKMKESDSPACSSRYGPVPNFAEYEPPGEDEARGMIERRFGLFRDSGGIAG